MMGITRISSSKCHLSRLTSTYSSGTDSKNISVDKRIPAHLMGKAVEAGEVYPGIAVCGTGNGISMTLNKHRGVRAALCWREDIAKLAREHNDANVLSMPGRFISKEEAKKIVEIFLDTPFEGGRHQRRIDKIPL